MLLHVVAMVRLEVVLVVCLRTEHTVACGRNHGGHMLLVDGQQLATLARSVSTVLVVHLMTGIHHAIETPIEKF